MGFRIKKERELVSIHEKIGENQISPIFGDPMTYPKPLILFLLTMTAFGAQMTIQILNTFIQSLLYENKTSMLSGEQIREGWLKHIKPEEENYIWVSNQRALDLMKEGVIPPATSDPMANPDYEMD